MKVIVGITRFALAGPMGEGGSVFKHRKKPPIFLSKLAWIRSPGYLAHRLALFKALALPSIAQQVVPPGAHYVHLVATNTNLPNRDALRADLPAHCFLVEIHPDAKLEAGIRQPIEALVGTEDYFTFRLDDDDALVTDYLAIVMEHWKKGRVLSPNKGFFIGIDRRKNKLKVMPAECPNAPQGIGVYGAHIHDLGKHSVIPDPYADIRRPYWLRTVHRSNVTLAGHPGTPWGFRTGDVPPAETVAQYFPHLSLEAIEAALRIEPAIQPPPKTVQDGASQA